MDYQRHFNGMIKSEYVIWGIPPDLEDDSINDTLLLASHDGKPITDYDTAVKFQNFLIGEIGCKSTRIQKITFYSKG